MRGELGHWKMPVLPVGLAERDLPGDCSILWGGGRRGGASGDLALGVPQAGRCMWWVTCWFVCLRRRHSMLCVWTDAWRHAGASQLEVVH